MLIYFGNYPNSSTYQDNVPIGWNQWDATETYYDDDWEEAPEKEIPDEEETISMKDPD